jgi:hypothetical protein
MCNTLTFNIKYARRGARVHSSTPRFSIAPSTTRFGGRAGTATAVDAGVGDNCAVPPDHVLGVACASSYSSCTRK